MSFIPSPAYRTLGVIDTKISVLEWYLASVHPGPYQKLRASFDKGEELMNPIEAFERMIRNGAANSYREGVHYGEQALRDNEMAKTATRWLMLWEPQLQKSLSRMILTGEQELRPNNDIEEKKFAYALLSAHVMARNWNHPTVMQKWGERLISHQQDVTEEKIRGQIAKTYWKVLHSVEPKFREITWEGLLNRVRHPVSLMESLNQSRDTLILRRDPLIEAFTTSAYRLDIPSKQPGVPS